MIAYLHGKLADATPTHVVVDCHGVGYSVFIPLSSYDKLPPERQRRETAHVSSRRRPRRHAAAFGFVTPDEREMFLLLISISGIGPKLAINILSSTSISALRNAIASGDTKTLSTLRGIGKKTAERLVVELKDKVGGAARVRDERPRRHARGTKTHRRRSRPRLARLQAGGRPQSRPCRRRKTRPERRTSRNLVRAALRGA